MQYNNDTQNNLEYAFMEIEIETLSKELSITILISLALLFVIGLFLNAISLIAILNNKKLEIISILILNLTVADIVYLTGIPFFTMSSLFGSWPFGLNGCRMFYLADYVGMTAGIYSVAALSLERLLVVTDNKKSLEKLSEKFKKFIVFIYLTIIWLIGIILSIPLLINISLAKSKDNTYTCILNFDEDKKSVLFIIKFILIFLIPFAVILFCSIKLISFLKNKTPVSVKFSKKRVHNGQTIVVLQSNQSHHKKAIKIVLSIVFMFIIEWLPLWTGIFIF